MVHQSYILDDNMSGDELFSAMDEVISTINHETELLFAVLSQPPHVDPEISDTVWLDRVSGVSKITIRSDSHIETRYVQVTAQVNQELNRIENVITSRLPIHGVDELLARAQDADNRDRVALARLGIGSPPGFQSAAFDILCRGLESDQRGVRQAATMAMFILKWEQFVPSLTKALQVELDPVNSRQMEATLHICKTGKVPEEWL